MRAGPRVPALLVALLVVGTLAAPAVPVAAQSEAPPPERTVVTVELMADGDARWNVTTYFELDSESDRKAFRRLADRFESGDAEVAYDLETFRRAVGTVDEERDREMSLVRPQRSNATRNGTGRLTLTFRWTNFAVVEGERLFVGDAFNTTDEWMPGLATGQRLVVRPPDNYRAFDAPKPIQQGGIVYEGPTTFRQGDLDIVFERTRSPTPTDSPTDTATRSSSPGDPGTDPGDGVGGSQLLVFGLLAVGIGAVALGAYLREDGDDAPPVEGPEDPSGGAGAAAGDPGEDEDDVDLELLSDEERVEYLLEQNGGRMKQANIVKETGWSNAKVSQLLSAMAEEERVDKLRIGRENLISLPDEDVAALDDDEE